MDKKELLQNIATTAYNVGFGGKKHLKTYDIYSNVPRFLSTLTIIIGIFQLLSWYKLHFQSDMQDFISALLVAIGIISLVIDFGGENKDRYDKTGKELLDHFNVLRTLYYQVKGMSETTDFSEQIQRVSDIQKRQKEISLSKQALGTNWLTHIGFFVELQSKWVVEELDLKWKHKIPLLHWETIMVLAILICLMSLVFR